MLACFACFSCSYEAILLCSAARASSVPLPSSPNFFPVPFSSARWVRIPASLRSASEPTAVEAYSSLRKASGERVKSIDRVPMRSFYIGAQSCTLNLHLDKCFLPDCFP